MAPTLTGSPTGLFLAETEVITSHRQRHPATPHHQTQQRYPWHIVWRNVIAFVYLHTASLYAIYLLFTTAKFVTFLWALFIAVLGGMGVTAGAHRLWAHKAYKAKWPLRVLLVLGQTMAFQNHIYEWVRDHRVHHKFTDTDADPHNSARGFFFSHIGWLMLKKHRDVKEKGKTVDMSDLEKDWVIMLQKKVYVVAMPLLCFVIPTWVPVYFWGENAWTSWYVAAILRYTLTLNGTWLVNSAAHIWGTRPYDTTISPAENLSVAMIAFGEGWHNYHHAFPWDYKTSELGDYRFNLTTGLIDFFAKVGWAYDLKTAPLSMVRLRAQRKGDGTWEDPKMPQAGAGHRHNHHDGGLWGWGDADMTTEDLAMVEITHRKSE
ncbi:hypothetical protein AAG570_002145 [Ranatra chinensis]|uniref:Fatty acid desaturase domain-containing protein n=1 Tax=Ranatra chinensis TaxID=642074 RepID=A0ABD0YIZ9_9HEMI